MNNKISNSKKYIRLGLLVSFIVLVSMLGFWGLSSLKTNMSLDKAVSNVSVDSVAASDLRIAVIRMDVVQSKAIVLDGLRGQKEKFEKKLRDELSIEQKSLEKEKKEIEKSQDVLSREALQRRVVDYQTRVAKLQQSLAERAQSIETSFQKALADVQAKHLDPIIDRIIEKKKLSLVIDGRFARVSSNVSNLDITNDLIDSLNKKISYFKMETPKRF